MLLAAAADTWLVSPCYALKDDRSAAIAPQHEQRRIVAKIEELFSELDKGVEELEDRAGTIKGLSSGRAQACL